MAESKEIEQLAQAVTQVSGDVSKLVGSMRQVEQSSKEFAENMVDVLKELKATDPRSLADGMKSVAESINGMSLTAVMQQVQSIAQNAGDLTGKLADMGTALEKQVSTVMSLNSEFMQLKVNGQISNDIKSVFADMQSQYDARLEDMTRSTEGFLAKTKRQFEDWNKNQIHMAAAGGPDSQRRLSNLNSAGDVGMVLTNVQGAFEKSMQYIQQIPGGGLIALMLKGVKGQEDWRSGANQAIQMFDQMGDRVDHLEGRISGNIQKFQANMLATKDEVVGMANVFARASMSGDAAFGTGLTNLVQSLGYNAESLAEATVHLDKMLKVQVGTTANMVASLVGESGQHADAAFKALTEYTMAAERAGVSANVFLNGIASTTQALKFYNVQLNDVAATQLKLVEINKDRYGHDAGYANTLAQTGAAGIAGAMTQQQDGMNAYLGWQVMHSLKEYLKDKGGEEDKRKMGAYNGGALSAISLVRRGGREFSDDMKSAYYEAMMDAMQRLAVSAGGNSRGGIEFAARSLFGMDNVSAQSLADMMTTPDGKIKKASDMSPEERAKVANTISRNAESQNKIELMLSKIETGITQVVGGLLMAVIAEIAILVTGIQLLVAKAIGRDTAGPGKRFDASIEVGGEALGQIMAGFRNLGGAGIAASGIGPFGKIAKIFGAGDGPEYKAPDNKSLVEEFQQSLEPRDITIPDKNGISKEDKAAFGRAVKDAINGTDGRRSTGQASSSDNGRDNTILGTYKTRFDAEREAGGKLGKIFIEMDLYDQNSNSSRVAGQGRK